jgi:hypothetical protein
MAAQYCPVDSRQKARRASIGAGGGGLWGVHDLSFWLDAGSRLSVPEIWWSCACALMSLI